MKKMATLRAIKSNKRHDAREALAIAIADAQAIEASIISHRSAIERARQMVSAAETKLEAARSVVADTRVEQAKRVADAATAGAPLSASSVMRAGRAALTDCEDDHAAAVSALEKLEVADLADLEVAKNAADNKVATAVNVIVADAMRGMIAECEALKNQLFQKSACWLTFATIAAHNLFRA